MYEELVRSLRICGDSDDPIAECYYNEYIQHAYPIDTECMQALCHKAADAVEELSKLANAIPHRCECCVGCELEQKNGGCDTGFILSSKRAMEYIDELSKPRWISVEEQLPEDRRDVQITVFWHDAWRTMYGYYDGEFWHLYAPMHTEVADVEVIGWMEKPAPMPLPEPTKEQYA